MRVSVENQGRSCAHFWHILKSQNSSLQNLQNYILLQNGEIKASKTGKLKEHVHCEDAGPLGPIRNYIEEPPCRLCIDL